MALTYNVTGHLEDESGADLTGSVIFERDVWLSSSVDGIVPPATVTATITSGDIDQALRATTDPDVSPEGWSWKCTIRVTGQTDVVGYFTLTEDVDLTDIFPPGQQPGNPDLYVTRREFQDLVTATGDPASATDLAALEAVVDADIADLAAETDRATTAEGLLDSRLDTIEAVPVAVVNTDGDPGVTIYIGTVEPTDPPYTLATGDLWIDSTPA